ncbi:DUF4190 domain-containing protein [Lacisediminihabitans changchengi]|uniref:DUF4190 domain-containing protein n=1 Tax=Lacisediminihabitans changchengi TaxID=2787634 RepID=A0A934SKL4_9MICO|nr:DUF4190 domain-containing protein [Lacisediminihabitans changchengi]MBK4348351.1 DUF4190 domain-containing protein [Lacisediminihabitans changchengi]
MAAENDTPENEIPPIPVPTPEQSAPVPPIAPPAYGTTPQPAPYAAAPVYTPGPPQGLSLASMITGIGGLVLSFLGLGLLASIAAVVTGHLAVKRQPYAKGLWLTGIITGYVGILFALIVIAFFVIFFVAAIAAGISSDRYGDF